MDLNVDKTAKLIKLNSNIYRCTQIYLDKKLAKFNLSIGTYPYLIVLKRLPGISQNEISRELNVDKAMSARTVKKLIDEGYIQKQENSTDVRAYKLYITKKAELVIPKVLDIVHKWIDLIVPRDEEFNDQVIAASISFLEKVLENSKKFKCHCVDSTEGDEENR